MARVVQANLVTLRVQQCRRAGISSEDHEIKTAPPGPITTFREHLIEHDLLPAVADRELAVWLRFVWGQFSGFCWLFKHDDPHRPPAFRALCEDHVRCPPHIVDKVEQVRTMLWRVRFEQQLRYGQEFRLRPDFHSMREAAKDIEVDVYGQAVSAASLADLASLEAELRGILSVLRWVIDDRLDWQAEGISDVGI
jgi:hypothetical protein